MKTNDKKNSNIQNRFTAYLVAAVQHTKIKYCEKKTTTRQHGLAFTESVTCNYTDFDREFERYMSEQYCTHYKDLDRMQDLLWILEGGKLMKVLQKLKERERQILFGRLFGELSFQDIGEELGLTPKQAEQAYFYVVRKLRKELGVKNNEI